MPKYLQLRDILIRLIDEQLAFDAAVPSERELAERFGVARMTVRQAVDQLVTEGRLYRVTGKGTFVARPKLVVPLALASFSEDMRSRGLTPGAVDLRRDTVGATGVVADALHLAPGEPVHVVARLRTGDGEPMAVERAHLPARRTPGLLEEPLADRSLYSLLEERYGLVPDAGEQTIEAALAGDTDAGPLAVDPGSPVLRLTRRSAAAGIPIEYAVSSYRADRYQLRVALDLPARSPSPSGERA